MKVNGHQLREAIKRWEMKRETVLRGFDKSFFRKKSEETKKSPIEIAAEFKKCEFIIAKLQAAQTRYNIETTVEFVEDSSLMKISLCEAVKRIGGYGRLESMWRKASLQEEDPNEDMKMRYSESTKIEWPVRVTSIETAVAEATQINLVCGSLRGAIAQGNTREMDFSDLMPEYFT
jgi:hypothetical protein